MNEVRQRRLAAVLAADIAGYSRLMRENEDATMTAWWAYRREVIDPTVTEFGGRVVKLTGDGFLAEFSSAMDAVSAALGMQSDIAERLDGIPDEDRVEFRMGINLCDVLWDDEDIYGDGVNIAARIESIADPGSVFVTSTVRDQVHQKTDVELDDLGDHELKNIDTPVRVYRVHAAGTAPAKTANRKSSDTVTLEPSGSEKPSIAVLPFENMSGDPDQDYFSDGITEDVITELSRFRSLTVMARNSSFSFQGKDIDVREVGQNLGVRYVVEGSVRKAGDRIRVTSQLVETDSGKQLWAQKFDRNLEDIFAVQDEVTQAIVSSMSERVGAADLERTKKKQTGQMVAYDYFLHGRELHHRYTKEDCLKGIESLEKAVELDPEFAQAWAWLACIIGQAVTRQYVDDPAALWPRCISSALKSLELDEDDSECHRILCEMYLIRRKFDEAEYHNERGLTLNPNDPRLVVQRGYLLAYIGRPEEGIEWVEKVLALDPFHPENYFANYGITLHAARRYEDAIKYFKRVPSLKTMHLAYLISCHTHLDQLDEAQRRAGEIREQDPGFSIDRLARLLMYKDRAETEHITDTLKGVGLS